MRPRMHAQRGAQAARAHLLEVVVVYVAVHAEEALVNGLGHLHEVGGEGLAKLLREHVGVVYLQRQRPARTLDRCSEWLVCVCVVGGGVITPSTPLQASRCLCTQRVAHAHQKGPRRRAGRDGP